MASPLTGIGEAQIALARAGAALPALERALALRAGGNVDAADVAATRLVPARALWQAHGDRARARSLAIEARAAYGEKRSAARRAEVDAWLARHPDARGGMIGAFGSEAP